MGFRAKPQVSQSDNKRKRTKMNNIRRDNKSKTTVLGTARFARAGKNVIWKEYTYSFKSFALVFVQKLHFKYPIFVPIAGN